MINQNSVYCSIVLFKNNPTEIEGIVRKLVSFSDVNCIHLVDNDKQENIAEILKLPKVKYTNCGSNLGYGKGHNVAINDFLRSQCTHIAIINSDISFGRDIFKDLLSSSKPIKNVGFISPSFGESGSYIINAKFVLSSLTFVLRLLKLNFLVNKVTYAISINKRYTFAPYLSGAFLFCNKNLFKSIGVFDERYFMYPEDLDITRRAAVHFTNVVVNDVKISHHHRAESKKSLKMFYVHSINMIKYFNKWGWFFDRTRKSINLKYENLNKELF